MAPIKALHVIGALPIGGAERVVADLVTGLNPDRYDCRVCCVNEGGPVADELASRGLEVHVLGKRMKFDPLAVVKLARLIRERSIGIVHTHNFTANAFARPAARLGRAPVVVATYHGKACCTGRVRVLANRILARTADRIIAVSDDLRNTILQAERLSPDQVITIPNGIDVERYQAQRGNEDLKRSLGLPPSSKVVAIIAALTPVKDHRTFLHAARVIAEREPDARFLIVGDGPLRGELEALAAELGISQNAVFAGWRQDVVDLLAMTDVSVLSSVSEGTSIALLESMAAGVPIVATEVGGNSEVVDHGKTGYLVPASDAEALADRVLSVLQDPRQAERLGAAAVRRAEAKYSIRAMLSKTEELYEELWRAHTEPGSGLRRSAKTLVKTAVKQAVASVAYHSGLINVLSTVRSRLSDQALVLMYHRVRPEAGDPLSLAITTEAFEKQVRYLAARCNVLPLGEIAEFLCQGAELPRNAVTITFDDGFRDNYQYAYPILRRYGVSATVFVSTDLIGTMERPWFDKIQLMIARAGGDSLTLNGRMNRRFDLSSPEAKARAICAVTKALKDGSRESIEAHVREIEAQLGKSWNGSRAMLNWDELAEMCANGIEIGSHGRTHMILTKLPRQDAVAEIRRSKQEIEERLGCEVRSFSYPNGHREDFDARLKAELRRAGYALGCANILGRVTTDTDPFEITRKGIATETALGIDGRFSRALFAAEVAGALDTLCFWRKQNR